MSIYDSLLTGHLQTAPAMPTILVSHDISVGHDDVIELLTALTTDADCKRCLAINLSGHTAYLKNANDVATTDGLPLPVGSVWEFRPNNIPYAICADTEDAVIRVVQLG